MELHTLDRQLAVTYAHHLAVIAPRRHLEHVGHARRGERVVPPDLEPLRQAAEQALAVVLDDARLAVQQPSRAVYLAAERLHHGLVPEAHAEGRDARCANELDELGRRASGAGGEDEVRRLEVVAQLLRPSHGDLRAELAQVVREVVRERVVVVDQENHACSASARSIAASSAASLFRHSWCSSAGSESATIPPPACSRASPSPRTIVRIAMQVSSAPPGSAYPTAPP